MNRYDLLDAMNQIRAEHLEETERVLFKESEEIPMKRSTRLFHTFLIAAIITVLLGTTAYAAGLLGMRSRETEPEETFPVSFGTGEDAIVGKWTGTFALEFDSPETCQPVRYRFGWLPEGVELPDYALDGLWIRRYDWEEGNEGVIPWASSVELGRKESGEYLIGTMFYAPQFVNGGALILMNAVPGEVEEETWEDLSVLKIRSQAYRVQGEDHPYEDGLDRNYLLLFQPEEGWILALRGSFPMEDLVKIAENVVVEQTEGLVEQSQYENPYDFFDAARG